MPTGIYKRKKLGKFIKCQVCNKKFYIYPYEFNIRKLCSFKCAGKLQATKRSHAWKGGKIIDRYGYVFIYMPEHPFANNRYVRRSRLVMEKYLKRYLYPKERIHHLGKKDDDRLEKLKLFPNHSKHMFFHWKSPTYRKYMSDIHKK